MHTFNEYFFNKGSFSKVFPLRKHFAKEIVSFDFFFFFFFLIFVVLNVPKMPFVRALSEFQGNKPIEK